MMSRVLFRRLGSRVSGFEHQRCRRLTTFLRNQVPRDGKKWSSAVFLALITTYVLSDHKQDDSRVSYSQASEPQDEKKRNFSGPTSKAPSSSSFDYVIVGRGRAGLEALSVLQSSVREKKILVLGKGYSKSHILSLASAPPQETSNTSPEKRMLHYIDDKAKLHISCASNHVVKIDMNERTCELDNGMILSYDRMLLAVGSGQKSLKGVLDSAKDRVQLVRTFDDVQSLDVDVKENKHIIIIGGGFLGLEVAAKLLKNVNKPDGVKITQIFAEWGLLQKYLPRYLSKYVTQQANALGAEQMKRCIAYEVAGSSDTEKGKLQISIHDDIREQQTVLHADSVIYAPTHLGGAPPLASIEGLELQLDPSNRGIIVDKYLRVTGQKYIFAAGDCISFPENKFGRRRVQQKDHAAASGATAARNMVKDSNAPLPPSPEGGKQKLRRHSSGQTQKEKDESEDSHLEKYTYLPVLSTYVFGAHVQALGDVDSSHRTIAFWDTKCPQDNPEELVYKRGAVFYISNENRVVGVLLWNLCSNTLDTETMSSSPFIRQARELLRSNHKVAPMKMSEQTMVAPVEGEANLCRLLKIEANGESSPEEAEKLRTIMHRTSLTSAEVERPLKWNMCRFTPPQRRSFLSAGACSVFQRPQL